jgi:hypothetical protein
VLVDVRREATAHAGVSVGGTPTCNNPLNRPRWQYLAGPARPRSWRQLSSGFC